MPEGVDVVGLPGGFSYGDYLRCGAIAAHSPIAAAISPRMRRRAAMCWASATGSRCCWKWACCRGALLRNAGLKFVCKPVTLNVATTDSAFTAGYAQGAQINVPVAHHDGNFTADADTVARLQGDGRVAFTYAENPNGSDGDIAGILSENRRVLGMMPHPERALDAAQGSADGRALFAGLIGAFVPG